MDAIRGKCFVIPFHAFLKSSPSGVPPGNVFLCRSLFNIKGHTVTELRGWSFPSNVELTPRAVDLAPSAIHTFPAPYDPLVSPLAASDSSPPLPSTSLMTADNDISRAVSTPADIDERSTRSDVQRKANEGLIHYDLMVVEGVPYRRGDGVYVVTKTDQPLSARLEEMVRGVV